MFGLDFLPIAARQMLLHGAPPATGAPPMIFPAAGAPSLPGGPLPLELYQRALAQMGVASGSLGGVTGLASKDDRDEDEIDVEKEEED